MFFLLHFNENVHVRLQLESKCNLIQYISYYTVHLTHAHMEWVSSDITELFTLKESISTNIAKIINRSNDQHKQGCRQSKDTEVLYMVQHMNCCFWGWMTHWTMSATVQWVQSTRWSPFPSSGLALSVTCGATLGEIHKMSSATICQICQNFESLYTTFWIIWANTPYIIATRKLVVC